jgi:hypothetical protein
MNVVFNYPILLAVTTFVLLHFSTWVGARVLRHDRQLEREVREDFQLVLAATLTLLGLIIGLTFSMATSRYDQRKNLEEAEANVIGTEYLRTELLPAADRVKVRALMKAYAEQRVESYASMDRAEIATIKERTAALQNELWLAVATAAAASPTPVNALAVAGMNEVISAQGDVQAAWWNRIPLAAWLLMIAIAVAANVLIGYIARSLMRNRLLPLVLPLVASTAFYLIADIDSPRGGLIRVVPQNLTAVVKAMQAP